MNRKYLFTIFCFLSVIFCIYLGLWQVERMMWKENLISQVEKYKNLPPEEFDFAEYDAKDNLFKRVFLYGVFLHDYELILHAKYFDESRDKKKLGYHIITPFLESKTNNIYFVNRGYVDEEHLAQENRKLSLTPHNIEDPLFAILRSAEGKEPWYMPSNKPDENVWFWIDIDNMIKKLEQDTGSKSFKKVLLQQVISSNVNDFKYPIPIKSEFNFYNQHLTYIITWFSLAFIISIMWYIWWRKSN